ncbi:MAG: methionyl-tRNA formyltransferase [Lachnospiraceae bacterium]|nr:methionyl-tRNA formyltransferase [Lachnospiraceae bacterium]
MRLIFMGTPEYAVPTLRALAQAGHEVVLAVTQPDKPRGRSGALLPPPVKEAALELGIPVFQPRRVREPECVEHIRSFAPEAIVVVAFGQILPQELLDIPPLGCINGHASLLPAYRGAAPVQWAMLRGESETGVTTMFMDAGLDTGDMILRRTVPIGPEDTGGSLEETLSHVTADLVTETLELVAAGTAPREKQPAESTTPYAGMLKKEMGEINFFDSAQEIALRVRALSPWPGTYCIWAEKTLKIWKAEVADWSTDAFPGQIILAEKDDLVVQTGSGALRLLEVQLEGKKRMETAAFLRGVRMKEGETLC